MSTEYHHFGSLVDDALFHVVENCLKELTVAGLKLIL